MTCTCWCTTLTAPCSATRRRRPFWPPSPLIPRYVFSKRSSLKGLSHEMDLAFEYPCKVSSRPIQGTRPVCKFIDFTADPDPGFWCPKNGEKIYSWPKWMRIHADPDPQQWFKLYRFISSVFFLEFRSSSFLRMIDKIPLKFVLKHLFVCYLMVKGNNIPLANFCFFLVNFLLSFWIRWKIPAPGVRGDNRIFTHTCLSFRYIWCVLLII